MEQNVTPYSKLHSRLLNTAAIVFPSNVWHDCTWVPIDELEAVVLYLTSKNVGIPEMQLVGVGASVTAEGNLRLGGVENVRFHKNPAIGRRRCPICLDSGKKGYIQERGEIAGHCNICNSYVDYLSTAFDPYFYYYTDENVGGDNSNDSNHVIFNTREQELADTLKEVWLDVDPSRLRLPQRPVADAGILYSDCSHVRFNEAQTFSRTKHNLKGTLHNTEFNFHISIKGDEDAG